MRLAPHRDAEADLAAAMASRTTIVVAVGIIMGQSRLEPRRCGDPTRWR